MSIVYFERILNRSRSPTSGQEILDGNADEGGSKMKRHIGRIGGLRDHVFSRPMSALIAFSMTAVLLALPSRNVQAEPLEIRFAWSVTPEHLTPLIPVMPKGIMKHYGKSYTVKPVRLRGSGAVNTAFAAGEIDMMGVNYQAFAQGISNAKLDFKVVGQMISDKPPYTASGFWVNSNDIKVPSDLKGKVVAVNAFGGLIEATAKKYLGNHGLEANRDYKFVELRFPAMLPALETGQIQAAFLVPPFEQIAVKKGPYKKFFTNLDAFGPNETVVIAARGSYISKHRDVLVDFFEDQILMRHWLLDPANRAEAIKLISSVSKLPPKVYKSWVFTKQDFYRDPNVQIDLHLLQHNLDEIYKIGYLTTSLNVAEHSDMSLVKDAMARLK